jgi:hypothetical protein
MTKYVIFTVITAAVLTYLFLPSGDDTAEIEAVLDEVMEAGRKKI